MSLLKSVIKSAVGAKVGRDMAGSGLVNAGIGIVAARIATRSIPGALLVGGAFVAKKLYDKNKQYSDKAQ